MFVPLVLEILDKHDFHWVHTGSVLFCRSNKTWSIELKCIPKAVHIDFLAISKLQHCSKNWSKVNKNQCKRYYLNIYKIHFNQSIQLYMLVKTIKRIQPVYNFDKPTSLPIPNALLGHHFFILNEP